MNNVETKLNVELTREFDELATMEAGTEKRGNTINELSKLMEQAIEIEKLHMEAEEKAETRKAENELKLKQLKSERIDQITRNTITGVSVVGGFLLTVWGTIKSIKFEETGTITTFAGRSFFNKLFLKK